LFTFKVFVENKEKYELKLNYLYSLFKILIKQKDKNKPKRESHHEREFQDERRATSIKYPRRTAGGTSERDTQKIDSLCQEVKKKTSDLALRT